MYSTIKLKQQDFTIDDSVLTEHEEKLTLEHARQAMQIGKIIIPDLSPNVTAEQDRLLLEAPFLSLIRQKFNTSKSLVKILLYYRSGPYFLYMKPALDFKNEVFTESETKYILTMIDPAKQNAPIIVETDPDTDETKISARYCFNVADSRSFSKILARDDEVPPMIFDSTITIIPIGSPQGVKVTISQQVKVKEDLPYELAAILHKMEDETTTSEKPTIAEESQTAEHTHWLTNNNEAMLGILIKGSELLLEDLFEREQSGFVEALLVNLTKPMFVNKLTCKSFDKILRFAKPEDKVRISEALLVSGVSLQQLPLKGFVTTVRENLGRYRRNRERFVGSDQFTLTQRITIAILARNKWPWGWKRDIKHILRSLSPEDANRVVIQLFDLNDPEISNFLFQHPDTRRVIDDHIRIAAKNLWEKPVTFNKFVNAHDKYLVQHENRPNWKKRYYNNKFDEFTEAQRILLRDWAAYGQEVVYKRKYNRRRILKKMCLKLNITKDDLIETRELKSNPQAVLSNDDQQQDGLTQKPMLKRVIREGDEDSISDSESLGEDEDESEEAHESQTIRTGKDRSLLESVKNMLSDDKKFILRRHDNLEALIEDIKDRQDHYKLNRKRYHKLYGTDNLAARFIIEAMLKAPLGENKRRAYRVLNHGTTRVIRIGLPRLSSDGRRNAIQELARLDVHNHLQIHVLLQNGKGAIPTVYHEEKAAFDSLSSRQEAYAPILLRTESTSPIVNSFLGRCSKLRKLIDGTDSDNSDDYELDLDTNEGESLGESESDDSDLNILSHDGDLMAKLSLDAEKELEIRQSSNDELVSRTYQNLTIKYGKDPVIAEDTIAYITKNLHENYASNPYTFFVKSKDVGDGYTAQCKTMPNSTVNFDEDGNLEDVELDI